MRDVTVYLRGRDISLGRTLNKASREVGNFRRELQRDDGVKSFVRNLDTADSRMGNLVQTAMALGPSLVPIGAAAVPAIAGLTTGLGAAAGAASTAMLAFSGVGDGLKALNDYQLAPTEENFGKLQAQMQKLGTAGADFLIFLDHIEPKLDQLKRSAREGLFPGIEDGIRDLMDRGPQINRIIFEMADAMGDLTAEAGQGLASNKFDDFFNYIETEARPILMDMGRTLGNLVDGVANMIVAWDPLADQFSGGLLEMSRDFARWSRNLDDNDSFQAFVDYVQRVTPKAAETLGSLIVALADIVEAAAPIGEVSLPIIKTLADTLGAIAQSPVGPVLISAAAGLSAVSRAVALYNVTNGSAMLGLLRGPGGQHSARRTELVAEAFGLLGNRAEYAGKHVGEAEKKARGAGRGFNVVAGGVGALALSLTDVDDSLGVSNTAMGIAIGTMTGPWGAAIGGAIGGVMDLAAWNNDLEKSVDDVNRSLEDTTNLRGTKAALADLRKDVQETRDSMADFGSSDFWFGNPFDAVGEFGNSLGEFFTNGADEAEDAADEIEQDLNYLKQKLSAFRRDLSGGVLPFTNDDKILERVAKAAERAGVNIDKIEPNSPEWDQALDKMRAYNREQDTVPGRAKSVRNALSQLESPLKTNSEAADDLEDALSNLLSPQLDAQDAMIEWRLGLMDLRKQLRKTNGEIGKQSRVGLDNRQAIADQARSLIEYATAEAERTGSTKRATKILREGRKSIIDAGVAAGISRKDMRKLADQMGLVPNIVATDVKTPGSGKAKNELEDVDGWIKTIRDKGKLDVPTDAPGAPKTSDELDTVDGWVGTIQKKGKVDVDTSAPGADKTRGQLQGVDSDINGINGKTVDVKLSTNAAKIVNQIGNAFDDINPFADGGIVEAYANGGVRESHIAQIARPGAMRVWAEPETGGEAYIPLAQSKRARSLNIWQETGRRLGVEGFADGGVRVPTYTKGDDLRKNVGQIDTMFGEIASAIGKRASKLLSKAAESLNVGGGFHWPLPRKYGPSGTWGSYSSGGSHPALDFPAPTGTKIFSVLPGKVMHTTSLGDRSYGNYTEINHGHGISSLYAHQSAFRTHKGARVNSGDTIGLVGSVGNSTGPHLHLELKRGGHSFDYTSWLHGGGPAWTQGGSITGEYHGSHKGLDRASPTKAKAYAKSIMPKWGWPATQWPYWEDLGNRESGWRWYALNKSSGAYGIPQSLPASKMASAGPDWRTNAGTQIDWMAGYIKERYNGPHGAINWHNAHNWYRDGGINLFDQGGRWKSGTLGANLSGEDEEVLNPSNSKLFREFVKAIKTVATNSKRTGPPQLHPETVGGNANGGGGKNQIGSATVSGSASATLVPGGIRSFKDLLELVSKPATVRTLDDLNAAWRKMRNEAGALDRAESRLQRIRSRSKVTNKDVRETERALEEARQRDDKATERRKGIESKLSDLRQEGGDKLKEVDKAERALTKAREKAAKDGKVTKSEREELEEAEKSLNKARKDAGGETEKIRKLEAKLRKARDDETVSGDKLVQMRERLKDMQDRQKNSGKALEKQERAVEKQRDKLAKATEAWKNMQQELIAQAREVAESITSAGQVFGGEGTSVTARGLLAKLTGAKADAKTYGRLIARLRKRGVDQAILDQILDQGQTPESLAILRSLSSAPQSLIKKINAQQDRLEQVANKVGTQSITPQRQSASPARGGHGGGAGGAGAAGKTTNINFNGPIQTTDIKKLSREIENRWNRAAVLVRNP